MNVKEVYHEQRVKQEREGNHMVFKGKIGVWFWLVLIGGNLVAAYACFHEQLKVGEVLGVFFTFLLLNIICVPMVLWNYVQIDGEKLLFVLGFCKDSMKVEDIMEVYKTHNPIAAGALSLDRVCIRAKRQEWIVSVQDKEQLFHELKRRNPKIQIGRTACSR
ncbi:PH domain-containing protein [Schaedlerella arabinosiphila]|nr:PH domain-containing protein [Schaedlerella arabinosiphila]